MIRLEEVSKIYKIGNVEVPALDSVSLEIKEGEFCAIMGPSGSGKSTLMNIIGCLDRPTKGGFFLEGEDIAKKGDNELARVRNKTVGFVFQNFNLLPRFNSIKNVELPLFYGKINKKERKERAVSVLKDMRLENRLLHKPTELSGGESQRIAIARALANKPRVICADEPTGNLDSKTSFEIIEIFKRLNNNGITIIVVTHNQEIASFAQRIIKLKDGKIV